jgi:hypothetical protein
MKMLQSARKLGWFRYRKAGFGVSPRSAMGWVLTIGLVVAIWGFKQLVRHGQDPLPLWFYLTTGVAIAIFTTVASLTTVREP